MDAELFDAPFNLAGEAQSSELTSEAEARVRTLSQAEARKAQLIFDAIGAMDLSPKHEKEARDLIFNSGAL